MVAMDADGGSSEYSTNKVCTLVLGLSAYTELGLQAGAKYGTGKATCPDTTWAVLTSHPW